MGEKNITEMKKLKDGGFVLIEGIPCVVEKVMTSKAGKHGAAKARVFARGIFDGQKKIIVGPGDNKAEIPIIEKRNMQVVAMMGENVQLMDLEDYSQLELSVPEEMKGQLEEGSEVLVWKYDNYAMIKQKR